MRTNDTLILSLLQDDPDWLLRKVLSRLSGYPNPDTCWVWPQVFRKYGHVHLPSMADPNGRHTARVHRIVWLALRGPIPPGRVLDHDNPEFGCHNRACANPKHLQAVTQRVNVVETGTGPLANQAKRTHCLKGHPLSGSNLRRSSRGFRQCRTCARAHDGEKTSLITEASRELGLSWGKYVAAHGQSMSVAKSFIEAEVS